MAIPPNGYWPIGAQGDKDDPYVVGYMATAQWLYEIPACETTIDASPRVFNVKSSFPPCDCVEVEVRFRSLIESRDLQQARLDSGPPLPEVLPLRVEARQALRNALVILRGVLEGCAGRGLYGATETLEEQIWFANSQLNCKEPGHEYHLYRPQLEQMIRALERGARHLDLPPDFWRAMLVAADNLGLIRQHFHYKKLLAAIESAENQRS